MDTNLQIYDYFVIATAAAFAALFLYTICRLMCNCSIYGCQKGFVVPLLTITYILTLFIDAIMILMIVVHEINIYTKYHQHDKIPDIIHIAGIYAILWFIFMLNSLTICGWFSLFADLFGFTSKTTKRYIYATLIIAAIYFLIIVAGYVLIELTNTLKLNFVLPILSYINLLPIVINLLIALYSLCKLPLSQPLDLSIGLYQKNTVCSCYTTITQYIWSMIIIPISQSIILIIYILDIDVWNFDTENNDKFMHFITNDTAKLTYFISQFIALLFLWNFLGISIKQSFRLKIVLDVLSGKYEKKKIDPIEKEIKVNMETMTQLNSVDDDTPNSSNTNHTNHTNTKSNTKTEAIHVQSNEAIQNTQPQNQIQPAQAQAQEKSQSFEVYGSPSESAHQQKQASDIEVHEQEEEQEPYDPNIAVIIDLDHNNNKPRKRNRIFTVTNIDPEHNFQITEPLGEGAYGPVFAAIDNRDQQMVALKVMTFDETNQDLLSEIDILQKCSSPYIVNFKDTFHKDNNIWLAMEYCDGGSILDCMKILGENLTELQCECVIYQSLKGLIYLHEQNLIHRDIKAANILINSSGCCKVADFGVAKLMTATGVGTTIGSPYWMAPEVFGSDNYDISADIWSLGIVAIECCIGKPPLSEYKPMQAMFMIPKNKAPVIPEYIVEQLGFSDGFMRFIAKCLVKNAKMRPTAKDLIGDEWVRKVEGNHKMELIPWIGRAIPLLQKERKLNAHIANQADESTATRDDVIHEEEIELHEIQHQPTGTFMFMPAQNEMQQMDDENENENNDDEVENENENENDDEYEEEDSVMEGTEVRHGSRESTSSSSEDGSQPDNVIMEF